MDLDKVLATPDLPFPWKVALESPRELIAENGDNIADFVDTGSGEDEVLCALAAHCSVHLPRLLKAAREYIDGVKCHSVEALADLRTMVEAADDFQMPNG